MARTLKQGDTGQDVVVLQKVLNKHLDLVGGPLLKPDGVFGARTRQKVVEFQKINRLVADGVVGPKTTAALLDIKMVTVRTEMNTTSSGSPQPAPSPKPVTPPAQSQPSPTPPKTRSFQVQAGGQVAFNPWVASPFVLTAQMNFFVRRNRFPPVIEISPGVQLSINMPGSAAGDWTGQAFVQLALPEYTSSKPIDWFNPFIQAALVQNQGQHLNAGAALGDQINLPLGKSGKYSLFLNGQEVWNFDLKTGVINHLPATQVLLGVSGEFAF
jgi:hypothetical protein